MTEMLLNGDRESLFTPALREQMDKWIAKYPHGQTQSAVIPCLHILQDANGGWLSQPVMNALAEYLSMPAISVYEVATFYSMFELKPVGEHKLCVCTNISCMLCGSADIMTHLENKLGIKPGETTEDGRFTLKEVECLGACVGAPMMLLNKQYHEFLTPEKIDDILEGLA
jgi:NADH-quinone oxidoreductase subunit E